MIQRPLNPAPPLGACVTCTHLPSVHYENEIGLWPCTECSCANYMGRVNDDPDD